MTQLTLATLALPTEVTIGIVITIIIEIYLLYLFIRMSNDIHFIKEFVEERFNFHDSTNRVFKNSNTITEKEESINVEKYDTIPDTLYNAFLIECEPIYANSLTFDDFKINVSSLVKKFNSSSKEQNTNYDFQLIIKDVWNELNRR